MVKKESEGIAIMGLNKSTGNMYSFIDYTWNTIKGRCLHNCTYCYMKRWGKQNDLRLDRREFKTDLGSGNFIFVGSSCDMFAESVPVDWIETTVEYCYRFNNKYLFQSKNPFGMFQFLDFTKKNIVVCTTIETNRWYPEIMQHSPKPELRASAMAFLTFKRYVTIEPVMDFDLSELVELIKECEPEQVNIGADSGGNNLPEPSADKVLALIEALKEFTTISQKRNLGRLLCQRA